MRPDNLNGQTWDDTSRHGAVWMKRERACEERDGEREGERESVCVCVRNVGRKGDFWGDETDVVERMGGNGNAMQCRGNGDGDASRCSLR